MWGSCLEASIRWGNVAIESGQPTVREVDHEIVKLYKLPPPWRRPPALAGMRWVYWDLQESLQMWGSICATAFMFYKS